MSCIIAELTDVKLERRRLDGDEWTIVFEDKSTVVHSMEKEKHLIHGTICCLIQA
jgi:hypothetical protein